MDINGIQKLNQIDPKKLKADPGHYLVMDLEKIPL